MSAPQPSSAGTRAQPQRTGRSSATSTAVSLTELLERVTVSELVAALGGGPLRRHRCRAWYRDGRSPTSLAIDDLRGCWYDHGVKRGGGKLYLIQVALGCDRRAACHWLASQQGVELGRSPRRSARCVAARRKSAEMRAADLTRWRTARLDELRTIRNSYWDSFRHAEAWRLRNQGQRPNDWRWSASLCFAHDLASGDACALELERLERMSPAELVVERDRVGANELVAVSAVGKDAQRQQCEDGQESQHQSGSRREWRSRSKVRSQPRQDPIQQRGVDYGSRLIVGVRAK